MLNAQSKLSACGCGCAETPCTLQAWFQLEKIAKMVVVSMNFEIIVLIMSYANDPWLWHATCTQLWKIIPSASTTRWLMVQLPRCKHVPRLVLSTDLFLGGKQFQWGQTVWKAGHRWLCNFCSGSISRSWSCKTCMGTFTFLFMDCLAHEEGHCGTAATSLVRPSICASRAVCDLRLAWGPRSPGGRRRRWISRVFRFQAGVEVGDEVNTGQKEVGLWRT